MALVKLTFFLVKRYNKDKYNDKYRVSDKQGKYILLFKDIEDAVRHMNVRTFQTQEISQCRDWNGLDIDCI